MGVALPNTTNQFPLRVQNFMKRATVQLLSVGVDWLCFGFGLQLVAQGTLSLISQHLLERNVSSLTSCLLEIR